MTIERLAGVIQNRFLNAAVVDVDADGDTDVAVTAQDVLDENLPGGDETEDKDQMASPSPPKRILAHPTNLTIDQMNLYDTAPATMDNC